MSYVIDKSCKHINHQHEARTDEGLGNYYFLNISQRFSRIWLVMIRAYNFKSTTYRLFCKLAQYLLSSIRLESIRFLSYV